MQDTTDAPGAKQEANAKFWRLNVHLEIQASYIPVFTNNMKVVSILILWTTKYQRLVFFCKISKILKVCYAIRFCFIMNK